MSGVRRRDKSRPQTTYNSVRSSASMQSVCTLARHADLSLPSPPQLSVFFYLPNATLMPMNHDSKRAGYVRVNKSDQGEDRRDERRDKADPPQGLQHQAVGFVQDFLCTIKHRVGVDHTKYLSFCFKSKTSVGGRGHKKRARSTPLEGKARKFTERACRARVH